MVSVDLNQVTLTIAGESRAGKTTLINTLSSTVEDTNKVGLFISEKWGNNTFKIYDNPGFEPSDDQPKQLQNIIDDIQSNNSNSYDINQQIHCLLYCINASKYKAIDPNEIERIKYLSSEIEIPIIIVLTQAYDEESANMLKKSIQEHHLKIDIVPIVAKDKILKDNSTKHSYGIKGLLYRISYKLQNTLSQKIESLQKEECFKLKSEEAFKVVKWTVLTNFGISAVLPPTIDYIFLIGVEIVMLSKISVIFGYNISRKILYGLVSSVLGPMISTIIGRSIFFCFLKLVPGAGPILSSVAGGSTAVLITYFLGIAYIFLMKKMARENFTITELDSKLGRERIQISLLGIFNEIYENYQNKNIRDIINEIKNENSFDNIIENNFESKKTK